MANWVKFVLAGVGVLGFGAGLAGWYGWVKWNSETTKLVEKLNQDASRGESKTVSFQSIEELPSPVARYFRFALKEGQPIIRTARIRHTGEFNLNDKWIPFESIQHFSAKPPAFMWDAQMRMNPLMSVRVRDGYNDGQGSMQARIYSLITVMNADSTDEKLASGALQRYLAELVWLPTALLPCKNLQWSAVDDRRALATLTDAGITVSLEFSFNEAGEITRIFSPARFKEVGGEYKPFPWAGHFWNYEERGGMMIPLEGEVEWQIPEGNTPYWRGNVVQANYVF